MKGWRWIFAFLRDPTGAIGNSIATVRAALVPLEDRMRLMVAEALRRVARRLALVVVAIGFALVGAGYVLIGLWLGVGTLLGPIAASFALGVFFLGFSAVPLALVNRMSRKAIGTDEQP